MDAQKIKVEYFYAGGCSRCAEARQALKDAAQSVGNVEWEEVDVGRSPLRAVDLGVVATPAVAIAGELVFSSPPTSQQLAEAVKTRLSRA